MKKSLGFFPRAVRSFLILILLVWIPSKAFAIEDLLTEEEKIYIAQRPPILAVCVRGAAPISFESSQKIPQGIAKRILDEIAHKTGLVFQTGLYDTFDEIAKSNAEIVYAISPNYALPGMKLTKPFLKSETILFMRSCFEGADCNRQTFAAIKGAQLPDDVDPEKVLYFNTREETLNAVEKSIADFGYGNAYSVAYYTIRNDYQNIVTVPQKKEGRAYSIGIFPGKDDEILLSILNKAIDSIDDSQLQALILDTASQIERKLTIGMVMSKYGKRLAFITVGVMLVLIWSIFYNIKAKKRLQTENRRYATLSSIANEYIYEFNVKNNELNLSEKCTEIFGTKKLLREVKATLKKRLSSDLIKANPFIKLPTIDGGQGVFRLFSTEVPGDHGKVNYIIGKLVDVSEEAAEKEELLIRAQIDGLTGIFNPSTTREYITKRLLSKDNLAQDAFLIVDCDDFKLVNDQYGHLKGDEMLKLVAKTLQSTFRSTDIVGRIGGDEFGVYCLDFPSLDVIKDKCAKINTKINKLSGEIDLSVSIGITSVYSEDTYEGMFKRADLALYRAKNAGKGRFEVA